MLRNVLILGGGSAGFITALTLRKILPQLNVKLLCSSDLGIIGVGEGTTRDVPLHLHGILGLDPGEFYRETNASWKLGIRFLWGQRPYYNYTFRRQFNVTLPKLSRPVSYFINGDFEYFSLASALMTENKVFAKQPDGTPQIGQDLAYHLENELFVKWLAKTAQRLGVEMIDDLVVGVSRNEHGIDALQLKSGQTIQADFYVDCSGFRSYLLGEILEEPFESFENALYCDRAIVGGWDRGPDEPIKSYTTAETMNCGWCWQIDHEFRINRGYVYSSKFISDEDAEREFRAKNPKITKTRVIPFKTGCHRRAWVGNVCAIGNSNGFVEPLEATAIGVICQDALQLAFTLSDVHERPSPSKIHQYNERSRRIWQLIRDFLAIHYKYNRRLDTPFWRACHADVQLGKAEELCNYYIENGPQPAYTSTILDPLDQFNLEGYVVHLLGQEVPCQFRYQPTPQDREILQRNREECRQRAQQGYTVEEAFKIIRSPRWQWNPGFYKTVEQIL
ncbi:MAG: tryptophan halogenase family protein [Pirellulales bacterium]|nr:tryptophan halogenase family protein [Pirellulales bacterium]